MSLTVNSRPATWAGTSGPIIYKMTTTDHTNAGYYLLVEIWNSTTGLKIGSQKCYPNSAGLLSVRVEAILRSNMSLDNNSDLTSGATVYLDGNWIKYYIKYNQYWSGSSPALIDDIANLRFAIYGGLQIGVINSFVNYINAKFLNIAGQAIINYPFTIEAILDTTANKLLLTRYYNNSSFDSSEITISSVGVNRFKIKEIATANSFTLKMINYAAWTLRATPADNTWNSVVYGNGLFVAVASSGVGNRVMTSPDAITWTIRTSASDSLWQCVTYGNGLFVAVATNLSSVMTSPDGVVWTLRTTPLVGYGCYGITYGNGLFVAVAGVAGVSDRVITSTDGITWAVSASATSFSRTFVSVVFGKGLFVAVSNTGTGNRVMTSPDGLTWTLRVSASDNDWQCVTFGNGLFVAIASNGSVTGVMTSPDGVTWTSRTTPAGISWFTVTYGDGIFVAVVPTGGAIANRVLTSADGITWTLRTSASDVSWYGVTYGNGKFVAVAITGVGNRVMTTTFAISETISIPVQSDVSNIIMLQWKNSLGGDECYPFTYNQEYTFDYGGGKKAKRLTLFAHGLTLSQWESINGLNTLGEPYKTPINEMTTSLNRTMATIGQSVYILNSDGTKIGVTVVNVQNTTVTKKVQHEATVTIEYPEIFLQ